MRSIPEAMTWEMFRHGRWSLLAAALGANVLPVLLFTALQSEGAIDPADRYQIYMHITLVQLNMIIFGAAIFATQGRTSRHYTFPIPTSRLVAWQLIPEMIVMAVELIASTVLLNAIFDLRWPLWGPALFVAVAVAAFRAVTWLMEKSGWSIVAFPLALLLCLWHKSRYGPVFASPDHYWTELTPAEVFTLTAVALAAYYVAIKGVARNRCGQPPYSLGIMAWLTRIFDATPKVGAAFRSPGEAQIWFESRMKGAVMPAIVVFGLICGPSLWMLASRDPKDLVDGFIVGGVILSLAAIAGGMLLGNCGDGDTNFQLKSFLGTRPITTTDLAYAILRAGAKSLAGAWSLWAASFLAVYLILIAIGRNPRWDFPAQLGWWYFPATLVGAWTVMSVLACLGLTGRRALIATAFFVAYTLLAILMAFFRYALAQEFREDFQQGVSIAAGVLFMLATAWVFTAARRRSLIARPMVYRAAAAWLALATFAALEWLPRQVTPISVSILVAGLFALAVAPLAAAPLALAWNRNR